MLVYRTTGKYTVLYRINDFGFWMYVARLYSDDSRTIKQWLYSYGVDA